MLKGIRLYEKPFKIIGKVFLGLLILITLFLVIMTVYNQIMLKRNNALYETPLGQLVEVDGHNISSSSDPPNAPHRDVTR